jgi:hypothetical protein
MKTSLVIICPVNKWLSDIVTNAHVPVYNTFLSALIGGYWGEIQILRKYGTYSKGLSGAETLTLREDLNVFTCISGIHVVKLHVFIYLVPF